MVAKTVTRSFLACALSIAALPLAYSQVHGKPDAHNTQKHQSGLLDYALSGVNSNGRDYGQCFDDARQLLIHETLERALFWSNLCSLAAAGFLFVVVCYQRQFQRRTEKVASEVIAQYHNALERAEVQITEAATRNQGLMKALSISAGLNVAAAPASGEPVPQKRNVGRPARESSPAATQAPAQSKAADLSESATRTATTKSTTAPAAATVVLEERAKAAEQRSGSPHKPGEKAKEVDKGTSMPADQTLQAGTPFPTLKASHQEKSKPVDQMGLFGPEVEFINKINVLQQQLSSSQEREKNLRRQLNDSELRFQKEQQKSRTLQ